MNQENLKSKELIDEPVRLDKTLQWLRVSRDSWKEKTKKSKTKLKIATLGLKRAREDRDEVEKKLKKERCDMQKKLYQKDIEISALKKKLEQAVQDVEDLKKNR